MSTLLSVSLIGGIMILVITGLRAVLQNRLHRTVFLLLWLLAALRLAIPVVFPSTASIYNLLPQRGGYIVVEYLPGVPVESDFTVGAEGGSVDRESVLGDQAPVVTYPAEESTVYTEPESSVLRDFIMRWIWIGGCGICFLYFVWVHIRSRLRYRFALPEEGPAFLGRVRLKRSDEISSPLVYGFFRPVILLPFDFPKKDSAEYEQVLHHELTHIRSGDLWFKLGMLLVTCVHWFNPLVWLMLHLSTQDLEIRCDARVIRKLGRKKAYAMALVQAEARHADHFAEAAFAFSLTEMRLNAISKTKVYLPRSIIICTIVTVVLLCCFSTGPMAQAHEESVLIYVEERDITAKTLPLSREETPVDQGNPSLTVAVGEEQGSPLRRSYGEYGNNIERSLKEGTVETPEYMIPVTEAIQRDPTSQQSAYDKMSEDPTERTQSIGTTASGQTVRSSNGNRYSVSTGDFTAAFSGTDAWANLPGETFDPFHR